MHDRYLDRVPFSPMRLMVKLDAFLQRLRQTPTARKGDTHGAVIETQDFALA